MLNHSTLHTIAATELWSSTLYYLSFRKEKKRVEKELLSTFKDESIIVMADWLKVLMLYSDFSIYWMGVFPLLGFFSICGVSNLVPYSRRFFKSHFIFLLILMRIRTFSKTYFNQF